jgi:hypothetical protein
MTIRAALARGVGALLVFEAISAVLWIAALLPSLPTRDFITDVFVALRGIVGAVELVAGMLLLRDQRPGATFGQAALVASAGLGTGEIGLRLVPSNLDPTFRWWVVGAYWIVAIGAAAILRSSRRGQ